MHSIQTSLHIFKATRKPFLFLLSLGLLTSCASHPKNTLPVLENSISGATSSQTSTPFIRHEEPGAFKSYLAMNLPYPEYEKIRLNFEHQNKLKLLNRGEAHITVITPPEFDQVLKKKITIKEIHDLAEKMKIQASPVKNICLGQGSKNLDNHMEHTYYVVVQSEELFKIRKAIQDLYISRGGKAQDFNAELFYPHVTLGYTKRDLHYEDGVIKDASSCIFALEKAK